MPLVLPAFIRSGSTSVYRVWVRGSPEAFEAPPRVFACSAAQREIVHPFLDRSGNHVMAMYSLSPECCRYHDALRRGAAILEAQASRAYYTVYTYHASKLDYLTAYIMVAWYLIDDDASIMRLYDKWNDLMMSSTDIAVWTVVAFIRNKWGLEPYLSQDAVSTYLDCYYRFVSLLLTHGVHLHTSSHPIG